MTPVRTNHSAVAPGDRGTNPRLAGAGLGVLLLAGSAGAWAIGLGEARVLSQLGEPLEVEIPIVAGAGERPDDVSVTVSPDERPLGVRGLRILVEEAEGIPVRVRLRTRGGHREPVVVLRLRLLSSSTNADREYTLLVDPPAALTPPAVERAPRQTRAIAPPAPAAPVPERTRPPAVRSAMIPAFGSVQAPEQGVVIGPVLPGDTLYAISTRVAAERGVDRRRLANAILAANPRAFPGGRPERLLAGAMLAVPLSPEALAGMQALPSASPPALAAAPAASAPPVADRSAAASASEETAGAASRNAAAANASGVSDLRARIAATREAIAVEEARRESLAARLDRANARIQQLLARQDELDQRQADLADAVASIETRARPVQSAAAGISPMQAAAAATLPAAAEPTAQPTRAPRSDAAAPAAPGGGGSAAQSPAPASRADLGALEAMLPSWLAKSPIMALALVAALVAAGLGYRRWRASREYLALDRYRDDELSQAVKQRIADVREEYNRTLSEADNVVIELEEERSRRAVTG